MTSFDAQADEAMIEAVENAQRTFKFFWRELFWEQRRIVPALEQAVVKVAVSDDMSQPWQENMNLEHLWMNEIYFDGQQATATLLNQPNHLRSVSQGDRVSFPLSQVSDWMYVVEGELYGGFTIAAMRNTMPADERAQHDAAWGLPFKDQVQVIPAKYYPDPALWQNYAELSLLEHPMSVNMKDKLLEALQTHPAMLQDADPNGLTMLHELALAGSLDCLDAALKAGGDAAKATAAGMLPIDMAKTLDWRNVIQRLS